MIDFTGLPKKNKAYTGANGSKISVVYKGEQYMLKFPPHPSKNGDMSYSNSCISEYLGCRIFESVGIPVQETMLGTYTTEKGGEKVVVACKDFTSAGIVLQDFASLKNQIIDSERNGYGRALRRILPKMDMKKIIGIIAKTPAISDLHKTFYKTMLEARKERILDYSMERLRKQENKGEIWG